MKENTNQLSKDAPLFEPEIVTTIQDELRQFVNMSVDELRRFEEIRVEVDWRPTVSVVLKPRS